MKLTLRAQAIDAIRKQFVRMGGREENGYTATLTANLLPGIDALDYQEEFRQGSGKELDGAKAKMQAVYSSSALALNSFCPWKRDLIRLRVAGCEGFTGLRFEEQCPSGLGGTHPNLDLVLRLIDGGVVAIESKFLEPLSVHKAKFAASYNSIQDHRKDTGWFSELRQLRDNPGKYQYLDAAQLIKHYLGLSRKFADQPVILLYLYWEPANWDQFAKYQRHREEVEAFLSAVQGSSVLFQHQSYPALWDDWEKGCEQDWLTAHLSHLRNRYCMEVEPIID